MKKHIIITNFWIVVSWLNVNEKKYLFLLAENITSCERHTKIDCINFLEYREYYESNSWNNNLHNRHTSHTKYISKWKYKIYEKKKSLQNNTLAVLVIDRKMSADNLNLGNAVIIKSNLRRRKSIERKQIS